MIRGSNDVEAKNPSLSLPVPASQTGNLSQGQETQLLQSCMLPTQQQQQQQVCGLSGGTTPEVMYTCNNGQPQQHVVRLASITTTPRSATTSNIATVVTAGTPFSVTTSAVVTPTTIGQVNQQTVTTPTSLQQYILTGEHNTGVIQIPTCAVQSTSCAVSATVHLSTNASSQQQTCTVGASSNLARILATTQGSLHVGYGSSTSTVPVTSTNKLLQPAGRTTVNHGTQLHCSDQIVHGENAVTASLTQKGCVDSPLVTSAGIRCYSTTPISSGLSCMVPQRLVLQPDRPTDDMGQVPPDNLHSYTASAISSTAVVSKSQIQHPPPSPCRTMSSGASVALLMTDVTHRLRHPNSSVVVSTTGMSQTSSVPITSISNRHKRVKLEPKLPSSPETGELRNAISDHRSWEMRALREVYVERLTELFFLESGHNFVDYVGWKKKANPQLVMHLKGNPLDSDDEVLPVPYPPVASLLTTATTTTTAPITHSFAEVKVPASGGTPVATSSSLPAAVTQISQLGNTSVIGKLRGGRHGMVFGNHKPPSTSTGHYLLFPGGRPLVPEITCISSAVTSTSSHSLGHHSEISSAAVSVSRQPHSPVVPSSLTSPTSGSGGGTPTSPSGPTRLSGSPIPSASAPESVPLVTSSTPGGRVGRPPSSNLGVASPSRFQTRQHSISAVYDSTIGSQEEIVERAKQEAHVIQRIAELRKDGLWSERRLPKVQEPQRNKAHWDYLLEEMVWLATDFAQERKWKKAAAKKCARMCQKFHLEQKLREERAEKEAEQKLKRIASIIAKEIKQFWANVEKFVEYKQQSRLDLKRKKVLDLQLSFIMDQTEKYSSWVAQGMSKSVTTGSAQNSLVSSAQMSQSSSPLRSSDSGSDEEFAPPVETSDDEETIALAEEEVDIESQRMEVELLEKESQVPLEDLLRELPPEILERPASPVKMECTGKDDDDDRENDEDNSRTDTWSFLSGKTRKQDSKTGKEIGSNDEFHVSSGEDTSDDETTIDEQEAMERGVDHSEELADLKNEGEMSIEDIIQKYRGAYESDFDASASQSEGSGSSSESEEEVDVEETDEEEEGSDDLSDDGMQDIGIESLINPSSEAEGGSNDASGSPRKGPAKEITDIAAAAESFKPKGYTYLTTQVATKVPFLVKHQLREYQHIGLDWLVTMYERKLNGILADEMGLGKTIQTIALLAHLACEKGNWGPHLIVVPTSVMLNWEMEFKKWCPAFKILTYYGTQKERKMKRQGWTKPNTFHVCITSYKLVIQDHQSFRRKKWKYFILDEAQNIKNFKSQRWQLLLNFQSQRRLLLTGTPLQNSLMELWSLMHFLMPSVFHSHRDFKEWFANPVSDMIEGSHEYDKELINRLHKVLRPFLLRRLKSEVEKQLPRKFEHVVMCRLSKRQRYLYDDFMSQAKTKETLATGNFMSVINVLMQLRKVCNHPNLFEARPTVSPFQMDGIRYHTASLAYRALEYDPFRQVDLLSLNLMLADLELCLTAFAAHRVKRFQTPKKLIEEIDSIPDPPPKCPAGKIKLHVRTTSSVSAQKSVSATAQAPVNTTPRSPLVQLAPSATASPGVMSVRPLMPSLQNSALNSAVLRTQSPGPQSSSVPVTVASTPTTSQQSSGQSLSTYTLQLVQPQPQGSVSVTQLGTSSVVASTPITVQIQQTQQGPRLMVPSGQLTQIPAGFAQLVQTSTGQHLLLTSSSQTVLQPVNTVQNTSQRSATPNRMTVTFSSVNSGTSQATASISSQATQLRTQASTLSTPTTTLNTASAAKPVLRVAPLNMVPANQVSRSVPTVSTCSITTMTASSTSKVTSPVSVPAVAAYETVTQSVAPTKTPEIKVFTKPLAPVVETVEESKPIKVASPPKSMFYLESVAEMRRQHRKERLERLSTFNTRRCEACPIYGSDLIKAVTVVEDTNSKGPSWRGMGYIHCLNAVQLRSHPNHYWNQTQQLANLVYTPESLIQHLYDILTRYIFVVPPVMAPPMTMHVSHPSPSQYLSEKIRSAFIRRELSSRTTPLHAIASATTTQFPDARLIQYDCGKLQTLDRLLRKLKSESRRVLIFTQMTRMLDVLEQFLNYHGHIYLRLDGTTRVEQRQALMERFNADLRIFCFILSTRSGGIGVNLTGADTVIFYDSDWNPTMDAQAQDRCHRIGQTRDVHIYRLVSERTVEENILKKANQKRLLGEVAIEGGNFTTAFFKKHTIQELFDVDFDSIKKDTSNVIYKDLPVVKDEVPGCSDTISNIQLEHALANAEEDTDVQAAKNAKKEADLELAEFDESIPYDGDGIRDEESSRVEEELGAMMAELTPVQRYAMNFLESIQEEFSLEQLKQAEEEIEAQKKDWELGRLQALREEEERRAQLEDNDVPFTYSREDANNQVHRAKRNSRTPRGVRSRAATSVSGRRSSRRFRSPSCERAELKFSSSSNSADVGESTKTVDTLGEFVVPDVDQVRETILSPQRRRGHCRMRGGSSAQTTNHMMPRSRSRGAVSARGASTRMTSRGQRTRSRSRPWTRKGRTPSLAPRGRKRARRSWNDVEAAEEPIVHVDKSSPEHSSRSDDESSEDDEVDVVTVTPREHDYSSTVLMTSRNMGRSPVRRIARSPCIVGYVPPMVSKVALPESLMSGGDGHRSGLYNNVAIRPLSPDAAEES